MTGGLPMRRLYTVFLLWLRVLGLKLCFERVVEGSFCASLDNVVLGCVVPTGAGHEDIHPLLSQKPPGLLLIGLHLRGAAARGKSSTGWGVPNRTRPPTKLKHRRVISNYLAASIF
ncbi:hypothetical protein KFK09_011884 [Dendrobium nobile]|uniref:Secreted protein n=1 Tax=Dendrobium nobile TaxID=94219 RepID=A0A8T3BDS5_DENNO|nr:hypothetical protein KFK09_011884 [Dendrobium nobile]